MTQDAFSTRLASALESNTERAADAGARPGEVEFAAPAEATAGSSPVGDGERIVREGECTSSIARKTGHFWETIWNEAGNSGLREIRKDPNVLYQGDRITVPPIRPKYEPGGSEMRHRFVRRGEPSVFRLRVLNDEREPRGNEEYTLTVDGTEFRGTTDPDGVLQVIVPGDARLGVLKIGDDVHHLNLHALDPVETISGVQARLKNLGYYAKPADGKMCIELREAIRHYQRERSLTDSGEMNSEFCENLRKEHRS